jgi:hypothetical protein
MTFAPNTVTGNMMLPVSYRLSRRGLGGPSITLLKKTGNGGFITS